MAALNQIVGKIKAVLWKAVFTEQVRPFVWLYYIPLWLWGCFGTLFAAPATFVKPVMGLMVYDFWVWLCWLGTTVVMCGLYLEDKAKARNTEDDALVRGDLVVLPDKLSRTSISLQTSGHSAMFFVLLAFEVSAVAKIPWEDGNTFSIFVTSPYVVGCALLTAQGMAKISVAAGKP